MPNTTNFNFPTPADTDLVKDGASAIRSLGNSIDTAFVDLKGGTTGQILSKASNTDLDYTWITNDVGDITNVGVTAPITGGGSSGSVTIGIQDGTTAQKGAVQLENSTSSTSTTTAAVPASVKSAYDLANAAIPKSLVDAAGDLIYATANDTVARLALGTAGQVLKVNSGATAPEWGAAGGAAALTKIASGSFSGQASVSVDSVFSSTYLNYVVFMKTTAVTGTDDLQIQLRYAGPTTQTSDYYGAGLSYNSSNTLSNFGFVNAGQATISQDVGTTGGGSAYQLNFSYVGNSSENPVFWGTGIAAGGQKSTQFTCLNDVQRTYTGFLIKSSSSNISGFYAVYGLEN